jgi:hypothetical protein
MLLSPAPRALLRGLASANLPLAVLAADLLVPPLMMFVLILAAGLAASLLWWMVSGALFPLLTLATSGVTLVFALALAWLRFGRGTLRASDFLLLPWLAAKKVGLYARMWRNRGAGWVRTDRQ